MGPDVLVLDSMLHGLDKISKNFQTENDFIVKVNDRRILNKIFEKSGFSEKSFSKIACSLDKLDKTSWDEVEKDICEAGFGTNLVKNLRSEIDSVKTSPELEKLY